MPTTASAPAATPGRGGVHRLAPLLAAAAIVLSACAPSPTATPTPTTAPMTTAGPTGWHRIAAGPLSARWGSVAAWLDGRFVVIGGATDRPCPPSASCLAPAASPERDGAAYDPASDRWTAIARAPIPVSRGRQAVVGDRLYLGVLDPDAPDTERLLRYDGGDDLWEELPAPPGGSGGFTVAGDRLVSVATSTDRAGAAEAVLDPVTSTWSMLPRDPFDAGATRAAAWVGGHLLLFSQAAGAGEDSPTRVAQLDARRTRWTVRRSIRTVGLGPTAVGDLVVFPLLGSTNRDATFPYGGVYDPRTERLTALPAISRRTSGRADASIEQLGGVVAGTVLVGGSRLDPRTGVVSPVPDLPVAAPLLPAIATGPTAVLVFGGASSDARTNSAAGFLLPVPAA